MQISQLNIVQVRLLKGDMAIVIGDLNGKVVSSNTLLRHMRYKHDFENRNDNKERFTALQFQSSRYWWILVRARNLPNLKSVSANRQHTLYQIGQTATSCRFRISLLNVQNKRDADMT